MSKRLILSIMIIGISLSFAFLNFILVKSDVQSIGRVGSASLGNVTVIQGKIYIYLDGNDNFNNILKDELLRELKRRGYEATFVFQVKEKYDGQFLAVKVLKKDIKYTPVYSKTKIEILFIHSTIGDTTHFFEIQNASNMTKAATTFDGRKYLRNQTMSAGIISISSSAKGIMSYKGHLGLLASSVARNIAREVERINREIFR